MKPFRTDKEQLKCPSCSGSEFFLYLRADKVAELICSNCGGGMLMGDPHD
jgi:uncharacterized Zn finger protein